MIRSHLLKMDTVLGNPVQYFLHTENGKIKMNELLGKKISLTYLHKINCIKCGRLTKTSFAQGYCYPCFISAPETEECVLRPELCQAHEGLARDMVYAEGHCLIDHFVYLAVSCGLKVGVTRHTQIPQRWIDQGANQAVIIARTPNRYLAGTIEVALKNIISDKTNWRDMLTNKESEISDLQEEKRKAINYLHPDFQKYSTEESLVTDINYPVLQFPKKVKSLSLDKTAYFEDVLIGIKGQYLMFETGNVINIRKHSGYLVELHWE